MCDWRMNSSFRFTTSKRQMWKRPGSTLICTRPVSYTHLYYHALADGLMCPEDKRLASSEISKDSRELAAKMFRAPVESFAGDPWPKAQAADLRKFLIQALQRQIEKKIVTAGMLEKLVAERH